MAIIDIQNYHPTPEDIFIFDSNIWVYLFDNTYIPEYHEEKSIDIYTNFFKEVLNAGSKVLISSFNVSEISKKFINNDKKAYISLTSELQYKKGYRSSGAYKNLLQHIKSVNEKIFNFAYKTNDKFEEFEHSKFFNQDIDFIDEYLAFLTNKNSCKLVTNDKDFKTCPFDIDILTSNKHLLLSQ